jgi:hypothetical protein
MFLTEDVRAPMMPVEKWGNTGHVDPVGPNRSLFEGLGKLPVDSAVVAHGEMAVGMEPLQDGSDAVGQQVALGKFAKALRELGVLHEQFKMARKLERKRGAVFRRRRVALVQTEEQWLGSRFDRLVRGDRQDSLPRMRGKLMILHAG